MLALDFGWISGWRGGALYPLAGAADRRGRFIPLWIGAGRSVAEAAAGRPRPRAAILGVTPARASLRDFRLTDFSLPFARGARGRGESDSQTGRAGFIF